VRINAWYRLNQKGYSIPFPIRTVEMIDLEKKTEQLRQRGLSARAAALAKLPILATLSPAQNRHVAEGADDLLLSAGQVVYRQGDVGDRFFVIREGTVDSLLEMPDGRRVSVGTIGSGEFFGEYSAMTGQPRPTTVQAATDVRCIAITRDDLQQIFEADPSAMERVSEVVAKRAAERTQREAAVGGAPQPAEAHERKTVLERMKHSFGRWGL
jgi:CRP-like cAMP-binding protein